MEDSDADFMVYCSNDDVEDNVIMDVGEYWQGLGQEQRNDQLSVIDALQYGDQTCMAGHQVKCTSSYMDGRPAQLTVTVH